MGGSVPQSLCKWPILVGMTRIQTSWEIAKRSWAVLKSDKSLAWFPVLSFIASLIVVGAFAGLVALVGVDSEGTKDALQPVGWVLIAAATSRSRSCRPTSSRPRRGSRRTAPRR
jgi:hypothetical protein